MIVSTLENLTTNDTLELGAAFTYTPYIRKKRINSVATAKAVFIEKSVPLFVDGLKFIDFKIKGFYGCDLEALVTAYNSGDQFTFTGHFGDSYLVEFEELTINRTGLVWEVSGKFRILCVIALFDPCNYED